MRPIHPQNETTDIDLDMAAAGYLLSPEGVPRHVEGIECLAADTRATGACMRWGRLPAGCFGLFDFERRCIWLAEWLFPCLPVLIRRTWTEELSHAIAGPDEEQARWWQRKRYGELLEE